MEITSPKLIKVSQEKNRAVFNIEPLFPGYGVTVGNALRRVLYSSLEGNSAVWVKIDGVQHEFSTISGIKEDVITIILNLKKLRFNLKDANSGVLKLEAKSGTVTGKSFEKNANVEIVNPEVVICNLNKGASLKLELGVEKGIGYLPVEKRDTESLPVGTIAIDANYSPIELVNFKIENTRVGQITNYDKIILETETDGTVDAEQAVRNAAEIVLNQFKSIASPEEEVVEKPKKAGLERKMAIEELGLPSRITNALLAAKIKTVNALIKLSEEKLSSIDGLGAKAIQEISKKIKKYRD